MKKRRVIKKGKIGSKQSFEGHQKNNFIYDNFRLSLFYMKKSWIFFLVAIILILLTSLIGYFGIIGMISPALGKSIDSYVIESIQDLIKETGGLGPVQLTAFIMNNNIKTAFFGMISGIYFAILPIIIVIFNGYVLGYVAERAVNSPLNTEGIFVLWRLLPHGIFEIPAILISIGIGIKMGLYPFFVKEKGKGLLSLLVSFVMFLFLFMAITFIMILFFQPGILIAPNTPASDDAYSNLFNNPIFSFAFYILIALGYVASIKVGLKILSLKDREIVKRIFADSFRVFVFIIVPLLIIAGIIEGLLIALVG